MQLLVSVANADEAEAALRGGAHIIDAKEPTRGALGPVAIATMHAIAAAVGGRRPLSAALGEADEHTDFEAMAAAFVHAGAMFVKLGIDGRRRPELVARALAATKRGAQASAGTSVIAVAFADRFVPGASDPWSLVEAAADAGADGILLDTADKNGPSLPQMMSAAVLNLWLERARRAGLLRAIAGRLSLDDVRRLAGVSADIIGVRGAACSASRTTAIAADKVRDLVQAIGGHDLRRHAGR